MNDIETELLRLSARGYCCSQILILLALRLQNRENPDLVRAVCGLCNGVGQGAGTCGVLTGAACVLGLYVGKGEDAESADDRLPLMLAELSDWFQESACPGCSGIRCEDILGGAAPVPDLSRCGRLIARTWNQILEILSKHGIDPLESQRMN